MSDYPDSLVKFYTAEGAQQTLSQQSLRWSAPNLFADPLEADHRTALNFDPHIMLDGVLRTAIGMIFSPDQPHGNSPLASVIRRWRDEERFAAPAEAEEVLRDLMSRMVDLRQRDIDELMADWRRFCRQLRICCFSTKPDNLACWQRFASNHRGVAIRFDVAALGVIPQKVAYQNHRAEITSLKEQLHAVLHNEQPDSQAHFHEKFLVKAPINSHEQEWRCFYPQAGEVSGKDHDDSMWYDDHPFERSAVMSVYFGAAMTAADKKNLLNIIGAQYSHCKMFQASITAAKYELEFQRITA